MYRISVNFEDCGECWQCETTSPGFRYKYGGVVQISDTNMEDDAIRAAAESLRDCCPNKAIKLRKV